MPKKSKKAGQGKLPDNVEEMRTRVFIDDRKVSHVSSVDDSDAFAAMGFDNGLTLSKFKENFKVDIIRADKESIVFDLVGIDAPIANAFRRVLLAETPSMAIDKVVLFQNTSVIQDEVLAHRLGLIPLDIDAREFKFVSESQTEPKPNEENTTVFTLHIKCEKNKKAAETAPVSEKYTNSMVLSGDLKWVPQGRQEAKFPDGLRPVHDDIVIAKLRPGQEIEAELHVQKGVGETHAKWSPVCTASYRLLPEVKIPQPIVGEDAEALVKMCPLNVFDIEDVGGRKQARVANARDCSLCRECVRGENWGDKVQLRQVRDHFIFSVETVGAYKPTELLQEAIKVFVAKCMVILKELKPAAKRASNAGKKKRTKKIEIEAGQ